MQLAFLTPTELQEITDYILPEYQLAWLKQNRWAYTVTAGGRPKVARRYAEMKYGLAGEVKAGATTQPNWDN